MNLKLSQSEENYLKAIFSLSLETKKSVSTNAIAKKTATKASSVSDMIKKLSEKGLISYKKYQGAELTESGRKIAARVVRKHRLWELFLVQNLGFSWDEVHDVAEQLEHIKSEKLIQKLSEFLNFPKFDPHGDPIPDSDGNLPYRSEKILADVLESVKCIVVGVEDSSPEFLKYLDHTQIKIGSAIEVLYKEPFDNSLKINLDGNEISISNQIAKNLYVKTESYD